MFFQLLFIHLFRPFLKYTQATSPLPPTVSPRKLCTQAAAMISKLLRLYKRSHGLRQICNIAVYIAHSACTIHLLNLPDKNARRDIIHGVKHLEEIAEGWLGARRTLSILNVLARKWNVALPEEAETVLARTDAKYGAYTGDISSPSSEQNRVLGAVVNTAAYMPQQALQVQGPTSVPTPDAMYPNNPNHSGPTPRPQTSSTAHNFPASELSQLRTQQYTQAVSTLQQQQAPGRHRTTDSMHSRPIGASPSNMFGGVEQLLRDSQDWAYRDQAQLATGFDNWNTLDTADPSASWMNRQVGEGVGSFSAQQQQQPSQQQQQQQQQGQSNVVNNNQAYGMGSAANNPTNNAANGNACAVMSWMNGANPYTNMMNYDEESWYN